MTREEAIEVYNGLINEKIKAAFEFFAPELAESEDERVRRALIEFLREAYSRGNAPEECAKWIVWLDQPKEQKSVEIEEIIRKARSEGRQEVIDHPEYYQLMREEALEKIDEEVFEKIGNSFRRGREVGFREGVESVKPADYCSVRDDFDLDGNLNQKPAWSEEDEKHVLSIFGDFRQDVVPDEEDQYWLKKKLESLRLQPKDEWSEEDIAHRNFILESLEDQIRFCKKDAEGVYYAKQIRTAQNWLKSLRPYWKPSEELLDALDIVANLPELEYYGGIKDKIRELYKQLKKRYESNR